jgi:hypothetical protein
VTVRASLLALALLLAAAAPAAAADVTVAVAPEAGVRLGNQTGITGVVTENGAPLAGRTVRLEVRPHPFRGDWAPRSEARTGADGQYGFSPKLTRNTQVRVVLVGVPPEPDSISPIAQAYVLPAFTLSFEQARGRGIRLRQVYTVPKRVRLTAPTRFYVGPCKPSKKGKCTAQRAPFRTKTDTRRIRAGRYVARATVRIPKSYAGRFTYVSCFGYSDGSGMGNPKLRCPRRSVELAD